MYSVKRNGKVVALFVEESDAEEFHERKVSKCEEKLMEERTLEYLEISGEKEVRNSVLMMLGGEVSIEAAKRYCVVEE